MNTPNSNFRVFTKHERIRSASNYLKAIRFAKENPKTVHKDFRRPEAHKAWGRLCQEAMKKLALDK